MREVRADPLSENACIPFSNEGRMLSKTRAKDPLTFIGAGPVRPVSTKELHIHMGKEQQETSKSETLPSLLRDRHSQLSACIPRGRIPNSTLFWT